jgi:signal transduction histidine kinase
MPNRPAPHPIPWPVLVALVTSIAIVLGSAYVARNNIEEVAGITEEVMHTGELLDTVSRLRSLLHAAETGQRGYLLTGDKEYFAPYARAVPLIEEALAELRKLATGKERQLRRFASVEQLSAEKLTELRSSIEAVDRGERGEAMRILTSRRGLEVTDALVTILSEMRAEELQLRAVYKDLARRQNWLSQVSEFVTTAVVLSQIALCYFLLLRYLRQRREAEASLAELNEHLEDAVRRRTEELRDLSRHLMTVREEEKARIARELHDEMGSSLTAVNMDLSSVRQRLGEDSPLAARLARATNTLKSTVEAMRRIIEDLRPTMLESLGLREAVRSLAKDCSERYGVPLDVDFPDELPPLPAGSPIGLFRIAQEALTNAIRHAKASSIRLAIRVDGDNVIMEIVDDGVGILSGSAGSKRTPHGLLGIRERATAMGGGSTIGSGPGGRGTEIRVTVPAAKVRSAAASPER